jgi:hypothetical protein
MLKERPMRYRVGRNRRSMGRLIVREIVLTVNINSIDELR